MAMLLNDTPEEAYTKLTLYGKSGSGKTTLGVTAPDPFILLSERQGFKSVKDAARRLGNPLPPTVWVQTLDDLRHILFALQSDAEAPIATALKRTLGTSDEVAKMIASLPYQKPKTIVLDSMTEMFLLVSDDIDRISGKKVGRDGLETKAERYWGVLRERSEKLIRAFRDLPYHVLFLALLDDRTIGEGDQMARVVAPAAPMKALPMALAAAVNAVGIVGVAQEPKKDAETGEIIYDLRRWVRFAGPDWMMTKPLRPLADVEVPDVTSWIRRIEVEECDASPLNLNGLSSMPDAYHPPADGEAGDCVGSDTPVLADAHTAPAMAATTTDGADASTPEARPARRTTSTRTRRRTTEG